MKTLHLGTGGFHFIEVFRPDFPTAYRVQNHVHENLWFCQLRSGDLIVASFTSNEQERDSKVPPPYSTNAYTRQCVFQRVSQ
jgi:hypothetical protein